MLSLNLRITLSWLEQILLTISESPRVQSLKLEIPLIS